MLLGQVFERFVKESSVSVIVRGLLEKALCPQILDELFERSAKTQYTRELLFSTVVNLMSLVVCGVHPSVHAAHQASSLRNRCFGDLSLQRASTASNQVPVGNWLEKLQGKWKRQFGISMQQCLICYFGYRVKIIDGNAIASSEHRLKALRQISSAPLPGQSLVVFDPGLMLAVDVFPCQDGLTCERSLFDEVLPTVEEDDEWKRRPEFLHAQVLIRNCRTARLLCYSTASNSALASNR